jgi:hypothetical protein
MKFNFLYILIPLAIWGCYYIVQDLQGQSSYIFFGTAESEPQMMNFEHAVLVRDCRIKVGNYIKKGDTLAILYRSELDKTTVERLADMNQIEVEQKAKSELLSKDRDLVIAKQNARISELNAQIRVMETEDSIKSSVKKAIYDNLPYDSRLLREKVASLRQEIYQTEQQTREQIQQLQTQIQGNQVISQAKISQVQKDLDYVKLEKSKLFLIAPMEGYVEEMAIGNNILVTAYKDLVKINPKKPNKIVGFIHESTEVPFQLGDSVVLESSARLPIKTQGAIIGSNPKLVELPFRLRKFTELRAWGREVFIQMPDTNAFYIGEKIRITLKHAPPQ